MAIRAIRHWPDPVLQQTAAPVGRIDDEVRRLAADMLETMYAAPGRGLAAPQVGVLRRIVVMDGGWKVGTPTPRVLVDPDILWVDPARQSGEEACLSIPGVTATVSRAARVRVAWTDLDGQARDETLEGFEAICAQHEIDHLDGIVILDRAEAVVADATDDVPR